MVRLPRGVRRLFRLDDVRPEPSRAVDDELSHYFDEAVRALREQGLPEAEARREARVRFGDPRAYRDALMTIDEEGRRVERRAEVIDTTRRVVAHALRGLFRTPGFTAAVVTILALGIGANAVMFGVVDRLLLSPPQHVVDADRVKRLQVRRTIFNGETSIGSTITWPDYQDLVGLAAFSAVGAYTEVWPRTVSWGDAVEQAETAGASASLFGLLGVRPRLGRFYSAEEDQIGAPPTVVLSEEYWDRRFGSDPGLLGRTVDIAGHDYAVVGVAPAGFTGVGLQRVDLWVPIQTAQALTNGDGWVDHRGWYWLHAVARLAPDATDGVAAEQATSAHRGGREQLIDEDRYDASAEVLVSPLIAARGPEPAREARVARWLAGVSLIVLLIACFNVTNLLLARAVHHQREIAVRLTLGVGRGRLFTERMIESLLLACLGAGAAVLVARVLGEAIHQALMPNVAFSDAGLGSRLTAFTLIATAVSGVATGVVPAVQAIRTDLATTLRASGHGAGVGRSRTRTTLLVGQAALSVVLLVGAGLFVRSLHQAEQLDLGFDTDRLIVLDLEWADDYPGNERYAIYLEVLEGVRRVPGVRAAGLTYTVPFRSSISLGQPRVPGIDSIPRHHNGGPYLNKVSSGYFDAMGLSVLEGRGIEAVDDGEGAPPVAVVSESMARAIWPAGDALGSCMLIGDADAPPCTEVIGVVENHRRQALVEDDPHFLYYVNQAHPNFVGPPQGMMIGAAAEPSSIVESVRAEARGTSTRIRFVNALAMDELVEPELRSWRLGASMFTVFGLLALIVAGWGLYSVLAFDVALRSHELGVRAALGAGMPRIVRMVLRQAMGVITVGTISGLVIARAAAPYVEPLLFRVPATDPLTYASVGVALLTVALLAGWLPAWRATRVDPREALQSD